MVLIVATSFLLCIVGLACRKFAASEPQQDRVEGDRVKLNKINNSDEESQSKLESSYNGLNSLKYKNNKVTDHGD